MIEPNFRVNRRADENAEWAGSNRQDRCNGFCPSTMPSATSSIRRLGLLQPHVRGVKLATWTRILGLSRTLLIASI
jgi:hypothetical protein